MKEQVKHKRTSNAANRREVINSRKNLVVIEQAINDTTSTMCKLDKALNGHYNRYDRRFEKYDEALTAMNDVLCALEKLRDYEKETIALDSINNE